LDDNVYSGEYLMKKVFLFIVVLVCFSGNAHAAVEQWYAYLGFGLSNVNYPGDLDRVFDEAEDLPGVTRTTICLDLLGFYWPVADNTVMVGGVINAVGDMLEGNGATISLNQYTYSVSAMKFFGREIGEGFFIRGDIGVAKLVLSVDGNGYDENEVSESGTGFLLGGGYGFPLSEGARLLVGANVAYRSIEDEAVSTTSASIGLLW
jgi:hypothetical protein